jgi:hypothetical protein
MGRFNRNYSVGVSGLGRRLIHLGAKAGIDF